MTMTKRSKLVTSIAGLITAGIALPVLAGGPLNLNSNDPENFSRWAAGGANIPYNPDMGGLGPLTSAQAVAQTVAAFDAWENLATASNAAAVYDGFPVLRQGREYLLFIGANGPVGLTTTMGLGQGCFHIVASSSGDMAVNEFNNNGLFKGMDMAAANGPVAYDTLVNLIQSNLGY